MKRILFCQRKRSLITNFLSEFLQLVSKWTEKLSKEISTVCIFYREKIDSSKQLEISTITELGPNTMFTHTNTHIQNHKEENVFFLLYRKIFRSEVETLVFFLQINIKIENVKDEEQLIDKNDSLPFRQNMRLEIGERQIYQK